LRRLKWWGVDVLMPTIAKFIKWGWGGLSGVGGRVSRTKSELKSICSANVNWLINQKYANKNICGISKWATKRTRLPTWEPSTNCLWACVCVLLWIFYGPCT